jgi:hypothetical protein
VGHPRKKLTVFGRRVEGPAGRRLGAALASRPRRSTPGGRSRPSEPGSCRPSVCRSGRSRRGPAGSGSGRRSWLDPNEAERHEFGPAGYGAAVVPSWPRAMTATLCVRADPGPFGGQGSILRMCTISSSIRARMMLPADRAWTSGEGQFVREILVGAAGFEPTTTSPPDWCATRLRHAPTACSV